MLSRKLPNLAEVRLQNLLYPQTMAALHWPNLGRVPELRLAPRTDANRRLDRSPDMETTMTVKRRRRDFSHCNHAA